MPIVVFPARKNIKVPSASGSIFFILKAYSMLREDWEAERLINKGLDRLYKLIKDDSWRYNKDDISLKYSRDKLGGQTQ